jgi:two-component system chemotaxis response regulator CheB
MEPEPLRILIVDDSRIFRGALESALASSPSIRVVGSVWNGEKAIEFIQQSPPDLVTLDISMPGKGGLETLTDIQRLNAARPERPPVGVLLVSALADRGAAATIEGLERGAFDFIKKPDGSDEVANAALLKQLLVDKIEIFAHRRRLQLGLAATATASPALPAPTTALSRFQAVAIGASTGGPEALVRLLPIITRSATVPLLVTQHFPEGMTRFFAESLGKKCCYRVVEATDLEPVRPRTAYIAPGGRHMIVRKQDGKVVVGLNDLPPENGCRPSVDVLFRSMAAVYSQATLAIILTGMGSDGAKGLGPLKRAGAYIIAQDEPTSVVWGMPGAAIATNLVDEVLPLGAIGPRAAMLLGGGPDSKP